MRSCICLFNHILGNTQTNKYDSVSNGDSDADAGHAHLPLFHKQLAESYLAKIADCLHYKGDATLPHAIEKSP